jgi:hypothetical protein
MINNNNNKRKDDDLPPTQMSDLLFYAKMASLVKQRSSGQLQMQY